MSKKVTKKIIEILDADGCKYTVIEHEPTKTSEDTAKVRGTKIEQGAKALVWHLVSNAVDETKDETGSYDYSDYIMTSASAAKRIDVTKLSDVLGQKIELASPKAVKKITDCNIGSVPPFGNLFNIQLLVDESLLKNDEIAFSAGRHSVSIKMKAADFVRILKPQIVNISQE